MDMEAGVLNRHGLAVEEIFADIKSRRAGIIKALTTDVEEFYQQCDPEMDTLCLSGLPNENWKVHIPNPDVPPDFPDPMLGINFVRDEMERNKWLTRVAIYSDTWLLAVAFFHGNRRGFDQAARKHLFSLMNDLPTIVEIVLRSTEEKMEEKSAVSSHKDKKSKPSSKKLVPEVGKKPKGPLKNEDGAVDDNLCGLCEDEYIEGEFWICCDACEKWFHGLCVRVTEEMADKIKQYKCPICSHKKARH